MQAIILGGTNSTKGRAPSRPNPAPSRQIVYSASPQYSAKIFVQAARGLELLIEGVVWLSSVVDKLAVKHHVESREVEEVLDNNPKIRFVEKGGRKGEDVYLALGQTDAGRYLAVLFIYKKTKEALILSARDMANKERRKYEKK